MNAPLAPEKHFLIGRQYGSGNRINMLWQHLMAHMVIFGASGAGKSKYIEWLIRQLMNYAIGFLYLDPHGDTAKDLMGFAAARKVRGDDLLWQRTHYLNASPDLCFAIDPFADAPLPSNMGNIRYVAWLETKVQYLCRAILRRFADADVDMMSRMNRWMENVLFACGTAYDNKNSHNGIDKMLVFTNPDHDDFPFLYARVAPSLLGHVRADFEMFRSPKRVHDRDKWIESTVNNLRQIYSTLLNQMYAQRAPAINIPGIMRDGGHIVADLGPTALCGRKQQLTLGGLLLQEVLHAKYAESEILKEFRRPFVVIVDECGEFMGEDLKAVTATRKFNCPIVLSAQSPASFAKGDLDLAPIILGNCGTVICFQQTFRKDKELLADRTGTGDLDFTRYLQEVQRQRGYVEHSMVEYGFSMNKGSSWGNGRSYALGTSTNVMISEMESSMQSYTHALGKSFSESHAEGSGMNRGRSSGENRGSVPILQNGVKVGSIPTRSTSLGDSESELLSSTDAAMEGKNESHARGIGHTKGLTIGKGSGTNEQHGMNWQQGGNKGEAASVSLKKPLMPNLVSSHEWNGLYVHGTAADQMEKLMQRLHCLTVAEAIVSLRGVKNSFQVKIDEVVEWWPDDQTKARAIRRLLERLRAIRPYYFDPSTIGIGSGDPNIVDAEFKVKESGQNPWQANAGRGSGVNMDTPVGKKNPFPDPNAP